MEELLGRTLGHYHVVKKIGAGGMGVVFRAHDDRLDRDVAIKVLPEEVAEKPDRLARFDTEAKALAALNHPNLAIVHGFETVEVGEATVGAGFIPAQSSKRASVKPASTKTARILVMELLEGESLRERIPPGGLGWQRASEIGAAVADGLAAAHGKGIVHRDLKPENIFLTSDGRVKILDFGLAQIKAPVEQDAETATLTPEGTVPGTIMGTLGYMSPEQLRGERADGRSDIFALGCVLYEMVGGKAAFLRSSTAETSAAILKEEPAPLSASGVPLPAELERTVRRCLEKSPEARFQSSSDLAYNLRSITTDHAVQVITPTAVAPAPKRRRAMWIGSAAVIVAAAAVLGWIIKSSSKPDLPPMETSFLTGYPGSEFSPALSPDGSMVAFIRVSESGTRDVYVKLIGGGDPVLVSDGVSNSSHPSWSPDGRRIAYYRRFTDETGGSSIAIDTVPALGGQKLQLTTTRAGAAGGLSWSPDGTTLAMVDRESPSEPDAIFLLSLETGEKRRLTSSRVNSFGDQYPRFSPDGRTVAFERWGAVLKSDIYLVPAEGGDPRRLTAKNNPVWGFDWSADGESLIVASGWGRTAHWLGLWRVPVAGGPPEALAVGERGSYPTVSRRGDRLCIRTLEGTVDVWREGGPASAAEDSQPSRLISSPIYSNFAEYSPDGRQILFTSFRSGSDELWICDADGSAPRQLTHLQRSNGAFTGTWSPDGRRIAFCGIENDDYDIYVVDAAGGVPRRITSEPSDDGYPSWSRDGHFIYFGSTRSGRFEVFKTAAAGGEAQQITTGGGVYAVESHDGSQLFFTKRGIEGGPAGIWRMPVDGAEAVQVHDIGQFDSWQLFEDGICLLNRRVKPPSIDFLDFATGEIRRVGTIKGPGIPSALGFSVSPDRRWVLYQGWDTEYGIILVENFR